jgi:hypothetical protein
MDLKDGFMLYVSKSFMSGLHDNRERLERVGLEEESPCATMVLSSHFLEVLVVREHHATKGCQGI